MSPVGSFHLNYKIKDCNPSTINFHINRPRSGDRSMGRIIFISDFTWDHREREEKARWSHSGWSFQSGQGSFAPPTLAAGST